MTRMTREFSLVLLGAGVLTTGYFLSPEPDFEKRSEEQARQRVGARGVYVHPLLWVHPMGSTSATSGKAAAMAGVSRGGFGTMGGRLGGGGFRFGG